MAGFLTLFLHYVDYNQLTINSIAVSLCLPFLLVNLPDANHFSRRAVPPPLPTPGVAVQPRGTWTRTAPVACRTPSYDAPAEGASEVINMGGHGPAAFFEMFSWFNHGLTMLNQLKLFFFHMADV